MKSLLIISYVLLTFSSTSQEGFDLIRRAENKINQGKYEKALDLLNLAKHSDYGFCGNAWMSATTAINKKEAFIYEKQGEFLKAANVLNRIQINREKNSDSIKMTLYLKELDSKLIKNQIDSCLNLITSIDELHPFYDCNLDVPFSENPFSISNQDLRQIYAKINVLKNADSDIDTLKEYKSAIKHLPFYLLLN